MRRILVFTFSIFCLVHSYSQDLLVTNEGDSLNCKITKVKSDNIYFVFKHGEEIRSTLLPVNQVKSYQYNYYQTAVVPADKIVGNEIYPHWRFAINGGWSYQTAKIGDNVPSDFKQYVEDLKSGYNIGGDITYYFSEFLGVGFKYQLFKTSGQMDNIYITQTDGTKKYGKMSDDISITFIGPTFYTRLLDSKRKNALLIGLALGYLGYDDKFVMVDRYTQMGSTAGFICDFGYDIGVSKNMAIGFNITLLSGLLSEYELSDGVTNKTIKLDKDHYIGLGRIDLSIGIRFNTSK
jgi:hypothetical protein